MRSNLTKKYFSLQTQKQIDIGLQLAKMIVEDKTGENNSFSDIYEPINQMLNRDEDWKEFYSSEMDSILSSDTINDDFELLRDEFSIEKLYYARDYNNAVESMQKFIDCHNFDLKDKGWYLQQLARYYYQYQKSKSIEIQKTAFKLNPQLLKPKDGIHYSKVSFIYENRMKKIQSFLRRYNSYEEICLDVDENLEALTFGVESDRFESALSYIGNLLGYISQRPDLEIRKGPDNLWCGPNNEYAFFECKNEVSGDRPEIYKNEAGQMNNHCAWFESEYGKETIVSRFMIIPTKNLSKQADFLHDVRIIRRKKLKEFKDAIKSFIKELSSYNIRDISSDNLQKLIDIHRLNIKDITEYFSETYHHL